MEIAILSLLAVRNCLKCGHWDGEGFCSLPEDDKCITGYVAQPGQVVCTKWVKVDAEEPK